MSSLTPTANHILVSIPSRYEAPKGPRSPDGKRLYTLSGDDAMKELETQIKLGGELQLETEAEQSITNLVRVGQVLQIPPQLTTEMVLCSAGNGKVRRFSDITPVVEVGDTVYLDHSCLTDENEILPGIYRVSYAAIICVIRPFSRFQYAEGDTLVDLLPVGGYVLLSRVWASDVVDYEIDGVMRKVRFGKGGYLIDQVDVPPLPNEGEVRWVDAPLKGALNELHPGQRVVIADGQALIETICGTEYLCVRHDYVLAKQVSVIEEVTPLVEEVNKQWRELETAIAKFSDENREAMNQIMCDDVAFGQSRFSVKDGKLTRLTPFPAFHPAYNA